MRHNDNCLKIFSTRSFPRQSAQRSWKLTYLLSQCPTANVWTSLTIITQPFDCHKHIYKPPVTGAGLALRKFHSMTKKTRYIFPCNCSPKCPEMIWSSTWDWKMNPLRMAGWGSGCLLLFRGGTEGVLLFLGGSTWRPRKGLQNQILKGLLQLSGLEMGVADFKCWIWSVFLCVNSCLRR